MKTRTMKKALSLFLAVLMIALAIPFTMFTVMAEDDVTTIASVSFSGQDGVSMRPDYGSWGHIKYAFDGNISTEAQSQGFVDKNPTHYLTSSGEFAEDSELGEYYALYTVTLSALSTVEDFTIWSPESYLTERYFANDAYDIYYSADGVTYTKVNETTFTNVCPKEKGTVAENSLTYFKLSEFNGKAAYKHVIDMNGVAARYIVIAVSGTTYIGSRDTILSEVTVNGTPVIVEDPTMKDIKFFGANNKGNPIGFETPYIITNAIDGLKYGNEAWTNKASDLEKNVKFGSTGPRAVAKGTGDFYGIFVVEMDAVYALDTVSIWSGYAKNRSDFVNDGYDIYYSVDGKEFTLAEGASFTDMCGDDTNPGANADLYKEVTIGSTKTFQHEIAMKGVAAKYIAVAVTETCNKTNKNMALVEITATGTRTTAPAAPVVPAQYTAYENANDGDLLYAVDFGATQEGFVFSDSTSMHWNRINPIVSSDGSAVTVDYTYLTMNGEAKGRARFNSQFDAYKVGGRAFTVEFTLDSTVPVGIQLDGAHGFVINPSTNTTSIGEYKNYTALGGEETYDGTGASKQTYAIELECASELAKNKGGYDAYYPIVHKLYVKNETNNTWELIRELPADMAYWFEWETDEWDYLSLAIARYTDSGVTSTVSDVNIYKGINVLDEISASSSIYLQKSLDGTAIRFVGVVNFTEEELNDFYKLGFNVTMTYDGYTYTNTYTTTTVFTSLIANGKTVYASEYGGTYFYAIEITGLGAAESEVVFDVDGIMIRAGETDAEVFGSITATFAPEA